MIRPIILSAIIILLINFSTYFYLNGKNRLLGDNLSQIRKEESEHTASLSAEIKWLLSEKENLISRVVDLEGELESKNENIKSLNSKMSLEINRLSAESTKQTACNKANEFSRIPADMVFRTNGCKAGSRVSFISSSTQQAIEYLRGFLDNYQKTGLLQWQNIPEVCLEDAQINLPILEKRYNDYLTNKASC